MRQEVIVSLEGARIVVDEGICQQGEYLFCRDSRNLQKREPWPLSGSRRTSGWNQ